MPQIDAVRAFTHPRERRVRERSDRSRQAIYLLERLAGYGIIVVGVMSALSAAGLNLSSLTVFAGCLPRPTSAASCPVTRLSPRLWYYTAVRLLTGHRSPLRFRL